MKRWHHFLLTSAVAAVALADVGPDYRRPAPLPAGEVPGAYAGTTNLWQPAAPQAHRPRGDWWQLFGDTELNRLETDGTAANQELSAATARFNQARAVLNVAKAGYFPHLSADPTYSRTRNSANRPLDGRPARASETYNNFTVPLDLTWELDLWGRIRRQVESTRSQLEAGAADLEAVRLALHAEIAADYFTLRAQEDELALLQTTAVAQSKALELTRNRRAGGIATDLDVAQAETQLRTTEAQIPAVELERTRTLNALATLTGRPAGTLSLAARTNAEPTATGPAWDAGLPSELLQRRPDIAAAERRMAAANADIGVAKGAFYPSFQFSANAGFQSIGASSLFDWPSRLWAIGPSMSLPLFEGGRNRAGLARARAVWEETVAHYRQTVLTAVQEVEDQLAARRLLAAQANAETSALTAARRALEISSNRYRGGLVTYLEVATAQQNALDRERAVARLRGEQQVAAVALVKALGGGWEAPPVVATAKP